MVDLIITGHGNFASGMKSSLDLICGNQENVYAIDFLIDDIPEMLEKNIKEIIDNSNNDILILSDLLGATPFKTSVLLSNTYKDKNIIVIGGTNLPMVIETSILLKTSSLEELKEIALKSGVAGISEFKIKTEKNNCQCDDGI
ncbi:PTS sugar transporter subunit IIA [Clostridium tarantellae]|uniref:PTS fructose transporter subunit IIA n=1 Tax=Clostridium tarantellae TaxID=39493 RepID=A0A6I1MPY3_9CLOT|nr:PTS sugar transporter subunit IIA [Clostridium tarantellae]MPQ44873.1 PTS fructose transporter subunit IIA [Clostridium tarantellae]